MDGAGNGFIPGVGRLLEEARRFFLGGLFEKPPIRPAAARRLTVR